MVKELIWKIKSTKYVKHECVEPAPFTKTEAMVHKKYSSGMAYSGEITQITFAKLHNFPPLRITEENIRSA